MLRCIELAKNGLGTTAPNPMVGCVIVLEDRIIGEGYTSPYGGPHAEVNAIHSVSDKSLLTKATLYVSLEPCSHYGKTPPCTDLIIDHKIPHVVIGIRDPHDKVDGAGIEKLRAAGIEVTSPVMEEECRNHLKRFLAYQEKKRPYIILKWAESADGFIAPESNKRGSEPKPYWITNPYSRQLVHQWRTEEQAILVGTTTALLDNPELTPRKWVGKSPLRVVIDRKLRIPGDYHLYDNTEKTLILTEEESLRGSPPGVEYASLDFSKNLPEQICDRLYKHQVLSFIVEGGAKTLQSFIDSGLWDEARIFTGPESLGSGLKAPLIRGNEESRKQIGGDLLRILRND